MLNSLSSTFMIYTLTLNPAVDRELTVPEIVFDTVLRASQCRVDAGGKGFNVSRMLQALGVHSMALAFAGGQNGEMLKTELERLGIGTDFVAVRGETRVNVSIVTPQNQHYIKVNEAGPTIEPIDEQHLLVKVLQLVKPNDWWVLSGSPPPGASPDIYATLVAMIQTGGAYAALDASGLALQAGCCAKPGLLKPNREELAGLTGLPVETLTQVKTALLAAQTQTAGRVVVSLGKDGALFCDDGQVWLAQPPAIREQNPIGAGDSMLAGLVWGLSQGQPLLEAMRWGVACGSATASLPGTTVGSKVLVESLLPQVGFVEG
ncbi:MAG: 1-phosphofructokinase [Chloroflexota bacterium]|jgi:1-phosphofructokinase family hexose kinase